MPPLAVVAAKDAVRAAFEGSLTTGLESERRLFSVSSARRISARV